MTATQQLKGLLAGVATVALIGTAIAQSTPPDPAVRSAPVGAGQQSTQQTPMGTTGTPAGAAAAGSSTAAGTSGSGTMGSTTPSGDTSVASSAPTGRAARADRN